LRESKRIRTNQAYLHALDVKKHLDLLQNQRWVSRRIAEGKINVLDAEIEETADYATQASAYESEYRD
jgi:hypothetical protein